MKTKKQLSGMLALALVLGTGACGSGGGRGQSGNDGGGAETSATAAAVVTTIKEEAETEANYEDQANKIEEVDSSNEAGTGPAYVPGKKAGELQVLCYYDLNVETPELSEIFSERFGGTLKCKIVNSMQMQEELSKAIAAGDSPDLVRFDNWIFPSGIAKNIFTPLDEWLDKDADIWAGVKPAIDGYSWKGKHYYFPQKLEPNYVMHYEINRLQEVGLDDPMDLYEAGEWDWNAFEEMCRIWCSQGDDYIGVRGASWTGLDIAITTGVPAIKVTENEIINNLKDPNIQRAMEWCEKLYREGYTYSEWDDPSNLFIDGKLLFMSMGYQWGHESAQKGAFNNNLDQEFAYVPYPKDPLSDKYYYTGQSVGYLCPSGAKNVQGSVQYILSSRIYDTDPDIMAAAKAKLLDPNPAYYPKCPECKYNFVDEGNDDLTICPNCGTARKQKFKESYNERLYSVYEDLIDPNKFELIYDPSDKGFGQDMTYYFSNEGGAAGENLFDGPLYNGASFTQLRDEYYNMIEAILNEYRAILNG